MAGGTLENALPLAAAATAATTAVGAKRLFSNRGSKDFPEYNSLDDQCHEDIAGSDSRLEKRNRNSDWPLKSNGAVPEHPPALRSESRAGDSATRQRSSSSSRPSRFVEGSMNDRTSQKPHLSYTGGLEASVQHGDGQQIASTGNWKKQQRSHGTGHAGKNSLGPLATGDEAEVTRSSGIFRFGRSLAAAFHPSSWKIWSKAQEGAGRDKIHAAVPEKVKHQRESNKLGNVRRLASKSQTNLSGKHASSFGKRDSGIEFTNQSVLEDLDRLRSSTRVDSPEEKRYGRVFQEDLTAGQWGYNEERASTDSSKPTDASLRNRKSSLPNIRTIYSHRKLSDSADNLARQPNGLRHLPSRKDLQKQQKLVKRVSDLEGRLEVARRQLAESLGEPIPDQASGPARSRFTPGGLASLPSESLLAAYTTEGSDSGAIDANPGMRTAVSVDEWTGTHVKEEQEETPEVENFAPQIMITATSVEAKMEKSAEISDMQSCNAQLMGNLKQAQAAPDLHKATPSIPKLRRNGQGKRKCYMDDDEEAYIPSTHSTNDDSSDALGPKRKNSRPRKLQKTGLDRKSSPRSVSVGQARDENVPLGEESVRLDVGVDVDPAKKRHIVKFKKIYSSPVPAGGRTRDSPRDSHDEVPPVPKLPASIFAMKDKAVSSREEVVFTESTAAYQGRGRDDDKIEEEEEQEDNVKNDDKDDVGAKEVKGEEKVAEKEPFEWPEDVF